MAYFIFILSLLMDLKLRIATILVNNLLENAYYIPHAHYQNIDVNIVQQTTQGFREEY